MSADSMESPMPGLPEARVQATAGVKASVSVLQTEGMGSIPICRSNKLQYPNPGRGNGMLSEERSLRRSRFPTLRQHRYDPEGTFESVQYRFDDDLSRILKESVGRSHASEVLSGAPAYLVRLKHRTRSYGLRNAGWIPARDTMILSSNW